jgi:hypothetical protein
MEVHAVKYRLFVCLFVCLYVRTYVCMYVCMYVYVCVCVRMYVCMYVCMYVLCMYVCMYVPTYVQVNAVEIRTLIRWNTIGIRLTAPPSMSSPSSILPQLHIAFPFPQGEFSAGFKNFIILIFIFFKDLRVINSVT